MNAIPPLTPEERELLSAERALRLLDGSDDRRARMLEESDAGFAAAVTAWNERLGSLFDEIPPVEPAAGVWDRVAAAIVRPGPASNVIALRRRVGFWRGAAVTMTALAASLALVVGFRDPDETKIVSRTRTVPVPVPVPVPAPSATPAPAPAPAPESAPAPAPTVPGEVMVAAITPDDGPTMAVVSWDEAGQSLVFTPATLTPVAGHSHQLWVVPAIGNPRSLGLVAPGPARRIAIADDLARLFDGNATVAISAERKGGSTSGAPEGPIVATGKLRRV